MRTIKFKRAHFKDEEKTQFSHFSEWGVGLNHTSFTSPSHNNFAIYYEDLQFTGLKDKNGKEIYEGDILKIDAIVFKDKQPKKAAMLWDEYCYGWRMQIDAEKKVKERHIEIIGNIHENKNLIES